MNPLTLGVFYLLLFFGARRLVRAFRAKADTFDWFGLRPSDRDDRGEPVSSLGRRTVMSTLHVGDESRGIPSNTPKISR